MPRESNDEGTKPFEVRPGQGGMPDWGGMFRRGDPSRVPPNRFHSLLNARVNGSDIESRAGLAYVAGTEEAACITGMIEVDAGDTDSSGGTFYFGNADVAPDGIVSPLLVTRFNEEGNPTYVKFWSGDTSITNAIIKKTPIARYDQLSDTKAFRTVQKFRGQLLALATLDGVGYVWHASFSSNAGVQGVDLSLALDPNEAANGYVIDMCVRSENVDNGSDPTAVDDVLYMGTTTGKILRWDGTTLSVEHTMDDPSPVRVICIEGTRLFAANGGPTGGLVRSGGWAYQLAPGGAWDDVAWVLDPIAGDKGMYPLVLVEFDGHCLVMGDRWHPQPGFVASWSPQTPTTITEIWPASSIAPLGQFIWHITGAVVAEGKLYIFAYCQFDPDALPTDGFYIGKATSVAGALDMDWVFAESYSTANYDLNGFFLLWGGSLLYWNNGLWQVDIATGAKAQLVAFPSASAVPCEAFIA